MDYPPHQRAAVSAMLDWFEEYDWPVSALPPTDAIAAAADAAVADRVGSLEVVLDALRTWLETRERADLVALEATIAQAQKELRWTADD